MRRRIAAAAAGGVALLSVSGCSALSDVGVQDAPSGVSATVSVAHPVSGFDSQAAWKSPGFVEGPQAGVVVGGNAVGVKRDHANHLHLEGHDVRTGEKSWVSDDSVFPSNASVPSLTVSGQNGTPYVVAQFKSGDSTQVLVFNGYETSMHAKPLGSLSVKGKDAKVRVSDYGILVTGADGSPAQYVVDMSTGKKIAYAGSPQVEGSGGTPVTAGSNKTFVTDYGDKGFGVAAQDSSYTWASGDRRAPGAEQGAKGVLLGTDGHVVVAKWDSSQGQLVAVQNVSDGRSLAAHDVAEDVEPDLNASVTTSADGRYVVWGEYVFDTQTSSVRRIPGLKGARGVFIVRGIWYGQGSDGKGLSVRLVGSEQPKPTPAVPFGLTSDGTAVFSDHGTLYAEPLA